MMRFLLDLISYFRREKDQISNTFSPVMQPLLPLPKNNWTTINDTSKASGDIAPQNRGIL